MAVGILGVVIDFLDQFLHAAKLSPAKTSLRDAIEPDLHLIEPGGISWSEVHVEPWPCGEPTSNSQMFVRGVIIHDDVHVQVRFSQSPGENLDIPDADDAVDIS